MLGFSLISLLVLWCNQLGFTVIWINMKKIVLGKARIKIHIHEKD